MPVQIEQRDEALTQLVSQNDLKEASKGIREDFIAIFGIFATLFIFLSIEIQILKQATRFSLLVGFSLFLLSAMLTFIIALHNIIREKMTWKDYYSNPILGVIAITAVSSAFCFFWAVVLCPKP